MKFIYFHDSHFTVSAPTKRKDNFRETCLTKLEEVCRIAKTHDARILCGGDLFHSHRIDLQFADEIMRILTTESVDPPIILAGNHDLEKSSYNSFNRSLIAHYSRILWCTTLPSSNYLSLSKGPVEIHFKHYSFQEELSDYVPCASSKPDNFRILLTHAMLTPSHAPFEHKIIPEFDSGGMDLVLLSHYHPQVPPTKTKDGAIAISPGALLRLSIGREDLARTPSVLLIDTETGKLKYIPLQTAKKVEDIFDLEEITQIKEKSVQVTKEVSEFLHAISEHKLQKIDLRDLLISLKDRMKKDEQQEVLQFILSSLEQIEEKAVPA